MRIKTVEHLRAPISGARLDLQSIEICGDEIISGRLIEKSTGAWYRIEEGIADLAPYGFRDVNRYARSAASTGSSRDRCRQAMRRPMRMPRRSSNFSPSIATRTRRSCGKPVLRCARPRHAGTLDQPRNYEGHARRGSRLRHRATDAAAAADWGKPHQRRSLGGHVAACAQQGARRTTGGPGRLRDWHRRETFRLPRTTSTQP